MVLVKRQDAGGSEAGGQDNDREVSEANVEALVLLVQRRDSLVGGRFEVGQIVARRGEISKERPVSARTASPLEEVIDLRGDQRRQDRDLPFRQEHPPGSSLVRVPGLALRHDGPGILRDVGIVALGVAGLVLLVAGETDFGWGAIFRGVGVFALGLAILPALAGEHDARQAPALFWSNPLAEVFEQAERDEAERGARERW
jgi:hypothetical protein